MSLKGRATANNVLRGKITSIRQIEDLNALYEETEKAVKNANDAAENANTAADNAEEQTIDRANVSDSGDLLLILKNGREINAGNVKGKDADYSLVANALKGNKSGNPLVLSDVSPLPHEIKVKLGEVFVKEEPYDTFVKNGEGPTFDTDIAESGFYVFESVFYSDSDAGEDRTYLTLEGGKYIDSYYWSDEPFAVGDAVYVEVNGNHYTLYFTSVSRGTTVQKYGKNLCGRSSITSKDHAIGQIDVTDVKAHGTYTLSADVTVFADDEKLNRFARITVYYTDGTSKKIDGKAVDAESIRDGKPRKFTVSIDTGSEKEIKRFGISPINYSGGGSVNNARADNIQLELSETATEYEPYRNPEPLTATDGTLSIAGNGESMTLIAEDGVTMEAEYNVDTKKYIDKKFAELQALVLEV